MSRMRAEILGLEALGWLAGDETARDRLLAATGVDGEALRQAAQNPEGLGGLLGFLLANEDLLTRFCEDTSTDPRAIHSAQHELGA